MTLKNKISQLFVPKDSSIIAIEEKFSSIHISDFEISNFSEITEDTIEKFQNIIGGKDSFSLFIKVGNQDTILFDSIINSAKSVTKLLDEQRYYDSDEDSVKIHVEINKNTSESINVYDIKSFIAFWNTLTAREILTLINQYKRNDNSLVFFVIETDFEEFYSNNIIFSNTTKTFKPTNKTIQISENCHFNNYSNFPYNPDFFELRKRPSTDNSITEWLDKLSLIFSIASLFDITSIDEKSNLYYKLNGYKSFEHFLSIDDLSIKSKNTYYKIFEWVYSEKSHISDKIGLARNILSLSLENDSIEIEQNVYHSIQSGYQTYLKENIKNYIEIRGKITDELSWISQKSAEIIKEYVGAYEKSLFVFLSFFISVFLFKFLKGGDVNNIFTIDATVFSFSFLLLSIVFLYYSHNKIQQEVERLKRKYSNLKNRYLDLLNKDDIDKILDRDKEFDYELEYINARKKKNTALWIITISVLLLTIIGLSYFQNYNQSIENNKTDISNKNIVQDSIIYDSILIDNKNNIDEDSLMNDSILHLENQPKRLIKDVTVPSKEVINEKTK